ncbi:lytic transglycosylase domain-containing protein [Brevundimonas sp.]|uniref:lytic transglycosylase domain-containing protein n=1 Tax=Brevundimonas sp. TaxID=1871086 RepID=UPI00198E69A6|nr:lytic transglycosylase domain-containing protein [Brevundimonas sp.]MBD3835371.1 lytic transglycosylase domain-containing protein [Brevundimonas sp.]
MVIRLLPLAAVIALAATPVAAQTGVDWRPAGGDLFVGAVPETRAPEVAGLEAVRLADLDQPFADAIAEAADRHGLDRKLLHALVVVESAYRAQACSHAGACGLTQLMPGAAADLGVRDRFDPYENLRGGADYLARQILRFGDLRLALAAYNSGPDRVARLGRIPNITETQNYVVSVINCYLALTAGRGVRSSRECAPAEAGS